MSDTAPEGPSLVAVLLELGVRRNVAVGLAIGVAVAALAYVYRIVLVDPAAGVESSPLLFGALAVTLAIAAAAFVTIVLTIGSAIRRIRRFD